MKKNETRLAERLKLLRGGVSQAKLAVLFGVAQPTYSAWEAGRKEPSLGMVADIAKHFGVTIDYLLGASDSRSELTIPKTNATDAGDAARLWSLIESQQRTIEALAKGGAASVAQVASSVGLQGEEASA